VRWGRKPRFDSLFKGVVRLGVTAKTGLSHFILEESVIAPLQHYFLRR